jgi:hypothetical protein
MYSFPHRPSVGRSRVRRSSWNPGIPGYANVVCHYVAGEGCWADAAMTIPAEQGGHIAAVSDQSGLGHDMLENVTAFHILTTDWGHPAIFTNYSGNPQNLGQLRTPMAFVCPYQISVVRSPSVGWSNSGAALGAYFYYDHQPYRFSGSYGFDGWPGFAYPSDIRRNGVDMNAVGSVGPINVPFVLSLEPYEPGTSRQWEIGSVSHINYYSTSYFCHLYLYEIIGFGGKPDPDTLAEIEAYLMNKYDLMPGER